MKRGQRWGVTIFVLFAGLASAQPADVSVSDITSIVRRGPINGVYGYAPGVSVCNLGPGIASYAATSNQHPSIGWSMYRVREGALEQIGVSWMFHTFAAVNGSGCGTCQPGGSVAQLGPGCRSPESANIMASAQALGPRVQVNASTGEFAYPFTSPNGPTGDAIYKLAQVRESDLVPGASYFIETQIINPQDVSRANDTTYRLLNLAPTTGDFAISGPSVQGASAIDAWRTITGDASMVVSHATSPGDGELIVASRAIGLGEGRWRYVYAIENRNSARAVRELVVPVLAASVSGATFHGVRYHSGEPFDAADWAYTSEPHAAWSTARFGANSNANALRFGTTYTFSFESGMPPRHRRVTLGMFAPGTPELLTAEAWAPAPGCAADLDDGSGLTRPDGALTIDDLLMFLLCFEQGSLVADLDDDGDPLAGHPDDAVNIADLVFFLDRFQLGC